jgi:hypothetical protein
MRHAVIVTLWGFGLLTAAGCGGGGGGGGSGGGGGNGASGGSGGSSVTSVNGAQPLATLSQAQMSQLCADISTYTARNISPDDNCKIGGLSGAVVAQNDGQMADSQLQAACSEVTGDCTSKPADAGAGSCDLGNLTTCAATATVSQFSACFADIIAAVKQFAGTIPACSALTAATVSTQGADLTATVNQPSCVQLEAACPDFKPSP